MKFYTCFSINLLRFLKANNIKYISKFTHNTTNKIGWVFLLDKRLEELLTIWSNIKSKK